jgi:CheY-like chemotaxis protein/anti-sigma regulatory factor (Ser/Thr protein kinase)
MNRILVVDDDRTTRLLLEDVLREEGFAVAEADSAEAALERLAREKYDLMLLDVWLPGMSGIDLLARLRDAAKRPRVVVMTSDDTPETILSAVREQAYLYVTKPVDPAAVLSAVRRALDAPAETAAIEVISAKPEWVELLVPCSLDAGERVQRFLAHLDTGLPAEVRENVGQAFRELLVNAIEWGGQLDPARKVRIAHLRTKRMLLYRIADPGAGFDFRGLEHAAVANPAEEPFKHADVREEKGIRPGGFGIVMARAMLDELIYNEKQNEVVLIKYLDA